MKPYLGIRLAGRPQGYILLLVLGFIVVLMLLGSAIAMLTDRALAEQAAREQQSQDLLDRQSTRATLFYLLGSQRMTYAGLTVDEQMRYSADERVQLAGEEDGTSFLPVGNELRLDSSIYRGFGATRFALQDARGLLSLNWMLPALRQGWYSRLGIPVGAVAGLEAKLLDYQDADDLHRLQGAEAKDYHEAKRAPPSNRPLRSPFELRRVMGWEKYLADLDDLSLVQTLSLARAPTLNLNTATSAALLVMPGMNAQSVARVQAVRSVTPFMNVGDFARVAGIAPVDPENALFYPDSSGTALLWSESGGSAELLYWTLTPLDDGGKPWRIEYEAAISRPGTLDAAPALKPSAKIFTDALPTKPGRG
ncbi:MAG: general secretion pathway protein GspK [Gammaproteobacteria bacterium]|nr:general secretion pathway protein GspK [Gammaproteobacteria bacterium]